MTKRDIDELRAKARADFDFENAQAGARYKLRVDALNVIESMLATDSTKVSFDEVLPVAPSHVSGVEAEAKAEQPSVIDSVRDVIISSPDAGWTTGLIERKLLMNGFVFTAKDPKSTINTALARLVEQGIIQIRFRGAGRKASIYQASDRAGTRSENPNESQGLKDAAA
jgi:hypothetical protein